MKPALLVLLVVAGLGRSAAQTVDTVAPDAGAFGTQVVIDGSGFGTAKPKVLLVSDEDGKARKLKLHEWSDTHIVGELRKLPAGTHSLQVQPKDKGLAPIAAALPFTVALPSEPLFTPGSAGPGEVVTMTAKHLGTKKGVVKVGGIKAKVTTWLGTAPGDGSEVGTVVFKLGKKTPAGPQPVSVKITAGEALFEGGLDVMQGDPGGGGGIPGNPFQQLHPGMSCEMDGVLETFSPVYKSVGGGTTTNTKVVGATDAGFTTFAVYLDYQPPASADKTKTVQQPKVHLVYTTLSSVYSTTLNPGLGDIIAGTSATATYTGRAYLGPPSFSTTSFGGAFSGTMVKVLSAGPDTMTITNGFFWTHSNGGPDRRRGRDEESARAL